MANRSDERRKSGQNIYVRGFCACSLLWAFASYAAGQDAGNSPMARSPRSWVEEASVNEIAMMEHSDVYLRYRMHVVDHKGDQVRDVIESRDGTVARLILRDGRPLSKDEDKAEQQRLHEMIGSPENYEKHIKNDATGKKLASNLIRLMPDAMIYSYTPGQPQTSLNQSRVEVVMDYHPNPKWSPPSTTAEALTGLEGRIWIDAKTRHVTRMEGRIFKPVNFGWGLLAHIYPGGELSLEQTDAGNGRWIYLHFTQNVSVRALMVKTMKVNTQIDASQFQVLRAPMSYQEAVRQLLATPLPH